MLFEKWIEQCPVKQEWTQIFNDLLRFYQKIIKLKNMMKVEQEQTVRNLGQLD